MRIERTKPVRWSFRTLRTLHEPWSRAGSRLRRAMLLTAALTAAASLHAQPDPEQARRRPAGAVVGTVVDDGGRAIEAARVEAWRSDGSPRMQTLTDSRGTFRIPGLAPGIYQLAVRRIGFRAAELTALRVVVDTVAAHRHTHRGAAPSRLPLRHRRRAHPARLARRAHDRRCARPGDDADDPRYTRGPRRARDVLRHQRPGARRRKSAGADARRGS